jgi:hypothetical protein
VAESLLLGLIDNADLTFTITGGFTGAIDVATGNPIVSQSSLVVRAKLDQKKEAPRDVERRQNTNKPSIWVEGYCCDPALLPDSIPKDAVCDCEIDRFGSGKLYLVAVVPKAALVSIELEDLVGQRIQGWFEIGN